MLSARLVGPLSLVMLAACAGVDSPSASCGNNPSVCPPNLLVDDAAESGLLRGPVKGPPTPPTTPTTPTTGPSVPPWTGPAAAAAAATKLKDSRTPERGATASQTPTGPEVEAAKKKQKIPQWRQDCINAYEDCVNHEWVQKWSCSDCIHYCVTQREWPEKKCYPRRGKK